MTEQLTEPSPDFVKFFASQVYTGRLTGSVTDKFTEITKCSLKEFIDDRITDRLQPIIDPSNSKNITSTSPPNGIQGTETEESIGDSSGDEEESSSITEEEMEGFLIIKVILREVIDISHLKFRCKKHYLRINLDDKGNKTVCRLWFKANKKFIGIMDVDGKEVRKAISNLNEIFGVAEILKDRAKYLSQNNLTRSQSVELYES